MNKLTTDSWSGFLRETAALLQKSLRLLLALRWPQLLLACCAMALLLVILPTALFLFIVLLIVKFVIGLFTGTKPAPRQLAQEETR
jgi:hypothetical protein